MKRFLLHSGSVETCEVLLLTFLVVPSTLEAGITAVGHACRSVVLLIVVESDAIGSELVFFEALLYCTSLPLAISLLIEQNSACGGEIEC